MMLLVKKKQKKTEAEIHDIDSEEEMPLVDSEASSLVNTHELLEFIDTMDMGKAESTKNSLKLQ